MSRAKVPRAELIADIEQRLTRRLDHLAEVFGAPDPRCDQAFDRALDLADRLQGNDEHDAQRATRLAIDLLNECDPQDAASPLGITLALTCDMEHQAVSRAAAGAILGVSRGQVYNLVRAGQLQPTGQAVTRGSLAERLLTRRSHRPPTRGTR